ncbi:UNVERIFIED_CONTAM: N-acetyl-glucosamine-6-phosphate deacetylase [Siphonaria sp. JEL0065]|nr:N-acetyl-glucosamine-6-phosphate deacetylase [Siphonaria sp. JEL0065]
MKIALLALVAAAIAAPVTTPSAHAAGDYLWPYPKTVVDYKQQIVLPAGGLSVVAKDSNDYFFSDLQAAIGVLKTSFQSKVKKSSNSPAAKTFPVTVSIDKAINGVKALVDTDESYSLNVTASGVQVHATSQVGARYALQTLSQLITADGSLIVADIIDQPRFGYRGFMFDTARTFFPVEDILRILDGLAANKINVFHWHIYDAQSFPIKWDSYPDMQKAAFKDAKGKPKLYTEQNVRDIVQYAYQRNIRVIPEFELPGHNGVFGYIDPSLVVGWNHSPWDGRNGRATNDSTGFIGWGAQYCSEPPCGQLDIRKPAAIALIDQLIREVGAWFEDPVLHVGHDEVNARGYGLVPDNWDSVPADATHAMMQEFEPKLVNILKKYGKTYAAWDEVAWAHGIENIVPKDAVIQLWEMDGSITVPQLTALGFNKIVLSPYMFYYLDCSPSQTWCQWDDGSYPETTYTKPGYAFYPGRWHTWDYIYSFDPLDGLSASDAAAVYGGFGSQWTETVKRHNVDRYVFPRISAIAERYWSYDAAPAFNATTTATRLDRFRASLINEHQIDASDLSYLGNQEDLVYMTELCDGAIGAAWQLTSASNGNAGVPLTDIKGNPADPAGFYTAYGNYCQISSLYNTNTLVHQVPAKVAYGY